MDAGLLAIEGKLVKGVTLETAEAAVGAELTKLQQDGISDKELQKVINKTESMMAFEDMSVMSRATSMAIYELMGDADLINTELHRYQRVTTQDILDESRIIFRESNSNTLYYRAKA